MLRPRVIPCLLIQNNGLVKTINFSQPKYVGDPINAVRIFNEKQVDEIIILDIDASLHKKEPNYSLIKTLAAECRMPLCYGGGVKSPEQIEKIINLGVEKVAISSAAVSNQELIKQAAKLVGSQSIVVVMDVKRSRWGKQQYELKVFNGRESTKVSPIDFAKYMEQLGAGEIVINSIDADGTMNGYDFELISSIRQAVQLPITALGGAGCFQDIVDLVEKFGVIGAGAGSLFVFKGVYRAVLINYPEKEEKNKLLTCISNR